MGASVTLPLWFVVLAGLLAAVGLVDRLLSPAVRWFFRRRLNQAIDELNGRLKLKIRPFKLTNRQVLVDRLVHDPVVVSAAEKHSASQNLPIAASLADVSKFANEIVPSFSAYAYFRVGARLARMISTSLYRVRLGYSDAEALSEVDPEATVIFVMNHRSNMDYVLVTYMASASTALSYAVGEWARVPILQTLIRVMGAYFIRRDAKNQLYRRVLARYVQMATAAGVTQAIFPEGGLSRDGRLRPVRLGLLAYIVDGFDPTGRDVVFVPVGINYDRVLEDRTLISEIDGPPPRKSTLAKSARTLAFLGRNLRLRLSGKWHRFGYACVSFGAPVHLKTFIEARGLGAAKPDEAQREALVADFGRHLLEQAGNLVPALPVPLVAEAVLAAGAPGLDRLSLKAALDRRIDALESAGRHVLVPHQDREAAVDAGVRMLLMRRILAESEDGRLSARPGEAAVLSYYANSIAHL